jgi:hypothetical protein
MKTKMIVVVVLAAMCVLPLSAQVKVGVEGGMNLSHYLVSGSDGYKAEQVGGMKPGFQLGVTVDYEIGKHWMLMSGLSWLQNRSTMKMMDHMVTYFPKTEIKMNNLILPLKKSRHQHQVILKLIVDCQACLKTYFHVFAVRRV